MASAKNNAPILNLGLYKIEEKLGEGGMGIVYRAVDKQLGRSVALKLLQDNWTQDKDRISLLRREARVLAALNHPNIATIYGLEEADDRIFLVMEHVPGETLAKRLAKGRLTVDEAVTICCQIAQALESAHEKGVVHRDLKPANVKITPEGKVKVLDFGLAKTASPHPNKVSETLTTDHTLSGMIVGTAAYMSPEQARGKPVDKRTDIWAFGCILWELLTGQRLFSGDTVSDILAKILECTPAWDDLPSNLPAGVRRVLERCLQKEASQRLRDIGDAVFDLEEQMPLIAEEDRAALTEIKKRPGWMTWIAAAGALIIGLAAGMLWQNHPKLSVTDSVLRLSLIPREKLLPKIGKEGGPPAVSPDGKRVAFAAVISGETQQIYIQDLDSYLARPVAGTEGGSYPFWSPDGEWLAFRGGDNLKKIRSSGGSAQVLAFAPGCRGGAWHPDGFILFAQVIGIPILRVDENGGTPEPVTVMDQGDKWDTHRSPCILPDGKRFLYFARSSEFPELNGVFLTAFGSMERKKILSVQSQIGFVPPNFVIHAKDRVLFAQAVNLASGEPEGQPQMIADRVIGSLINAQPDFSAAANGTIVYRDWESLPVVKFFWTDRTGKFQTEVLGAGIEQEALGSSLSPDSSRLLLSRGEKDADSSNLWILHLEKGTLTRLTSEKRLDFLPVWSPDGEDVAFSVLPIGGGIPRINQISVSGLEDSVELKGPAGRMLVSSWSPDGRYIVYYDVVDGQYDLNALPVAGGDPVSIANSRFNERRGELSPHGDWAAILTNESGGYELYVQDFPTASRKWRISINGAVDMAWSGDGKELYYLTPDNWIMVLPVDGANSFENPQPSKLFALPELSRNLANIKLLVSRDGSRFLFPRLEESSKSMPIRVVMNWTRPLNSQEKKS